MHPLPEYPHTAAFGVTRAVPVNTQMIVFENGRLNRHKNPQRASVRGSLNGHLPAWRLKTVTAPRDVSVRVYG
jgi:hypothetical protein